MTFLGSKPGFESVGLARRRPSGSFGSGGDGLFVSVAVVLLLFTQAHCGAARKNERAVTPVNTNEEADVKGARPQGLTLELTSDRAELTPGQCANLSLTVFNPGEQSARWGKDWVFEQDGSGTPLAEAFPRSDLELPPGSTTQVVSIRLCHADLSPGTHRYRINAAPTSASAPRSNQVTIRVLP
jgi:hypothetical protein